MTDREMLLIAYGAMKESEVSAFIVQLLEKHLAVELEIEKKEKELDKRKSS